MLNTVNLIFWLIVGTLVIYVSIYLTFMSNFLQFRFIKMIKEISKKKDINGISSFKTLMISLGGKIGVGSISGVAIAIYYGGPGIIFWMIVISFLLAILTFYEVFLGNYYKEIDYGNINKGGPYYYIKKGLKNNKLSYLYSLLVFICYNVCFLSIQSNTIIKMANLYININPIIIGIVLCILILLIIHKGLYLIAKVSNIIVPIMLIIYILFSFIILLKNLNNIDEMVSLIMNNAFRIKSLIFSFIPMIIMAIQRTIFATESGIGTSAIISSTTRDNPLKQAYIQLLGVYITSLIICVSTAIIILFTKFQLFQLQDINGIELVIYAFNYHFGNKGNILLFIIVLLFCLSTIIAGYFNGESCAKSIHFNNLFLLKLITIIIIFIGFFIQSLLLWSLADILIGLILLINCYAIYKLRNKVKEEIK